MDVCSFASFSYVMEEVKTRVVGSMHGAVQCSIAQCSAVQCNSVQCSAVQCSAVQLSTEALKWWFLGLLTGYLLSQIIGTSAFDLWQDTCCHRSKADVPMIYQLCIYGVFIMYFDLSMMYLWCIYDVLTMHFHQCLRSRVSCIPIAKISARFTLCHIVTGCNILNAIILDF